MVDGRVLQGLLLPALWALLALFLTFVPLWALYRWGVLRERITRFARPIRLLIYLVSALATLEAGGTPVIRVVDGILTDPDTPGHPVQKLVTTILYILGALLATALLDTILFEVYYSEQRGKHIPKLLRDALKLVIIAGTVGYALVKVYGANTATLGGGAAVLTLVLGLALQNVLGDLFSGIVLQFERPFVKGDWIHVGEFDGEVVELNWRATRLNTRRNIGVVIPNSVMAKTEIRNLNLASPMTAVDHLVGVEYKEPPNRIKSALMEAILQCPDVLRQPAPHVWTDEFGDSAIIYRFRFWIRDFRRMPEISDAVMTNVWYVFKRYNITIPWPIRNVYMRAEQEPTAEESADQITDLLRQVDLFTPLTRNQLEMLSKGLVPKFFGSGEVLIRQGDEGDSFYIIERGQVEVLAAPTDGGAPQRVAMLGPREFFGEMSLLAGDRRTATVRAVEDTRVVIIDKDAFGAAIHENPEVAAEMASIYYTRSEQLAALNEQAREAGAITPSETGEKALLRRIQRFFGL